MNAGRLPVLWLYGPSGVGKTAACWRLFDRLRADGIPTGYVDIDQLGMCYGAPTPDNWSPEPASDPGRHVLKARVLNDVVGNFRAAGARSLIVSGVVDPRRGVEADLVPAAELTLCRLRAELATLRRRLTVRGLSTDDVDDALCEAEIYDRTHPSGLVVDTTDRTVDDVLRAVRDLTGWPDSVASQVSPAVPVLPAGPAVPGAVLWLCGVTASGKSSVGWEVYRGVRGAGHRAAFVDLDQLGFYGPVPDGDPGNHRLKAANLAAGWRNFHDAGATCLVVVGPVDRAETVTAYAAALPGATVTVCRLHAGRVTISRRVMLRGGGHAPGWGMAGDELVGRPARVLAGIAGRAADEAEALDRAGVGDLCVDTDDRPVPDIAAEILSRTRWPPIG